LAAASSLNQEYENERKEKERMKHEYEKEFAHMKKQINALEQENKKLLDTLIRHSKGEDLSKTKESAYEAGSAQAIFR